MIPLRCPYGILFIAYYVLVDTVEKAKLLIYLLCSISDCLLLASFYFFFSCKFN